ncbi:MAG: hypothetical protein K2J15_01365 [Muribaculaceae bacterium]|nr:hypothetical protein [Muribaculaceae bacterium]
MAKIYTNWDPELPAYHQRALKHNYCAPFIYHIILKKQPEFEPFGTLCGDANIRPGLPGCARIIESPVGTIIAKSIVHLPYLYPILKNYQYIVMPDHVHILLRVMNWSDYHLDFYVEQLVNQIAASYSAQTGKTIVPSDIFIKGYCDKPLLRKRNLNTLFTYIRENPHRLAMRRQYPQFFQTIRHLRIGDKTCQAYGNLFLLRNPEKYAVKLSHSFSPEKTAQLKALWLSEATKESILVSPFISAGEKDIRILSEESGARIILIVHEILGDRFKPAHHDFTLCTEGRLLIISLGYPRNTPLTRSICQQMNTFAEFLVNPEEK